MRRLAYGSPAIWVFVAFAVVEGAGDAFFRPALAGQAVLAFGAVWSAAGAAFVLVLPSVREVTWRDGEADELPQNSAGKPSAIPNSP